MSLPTVDHPPAIPVLDTRVTGSALPPHVPPVGWEVAGERAERILAGMSRKEKLDYVCGENDFFIRGMPRHGVPEVYLSDASQGVKLRPKLSPRLQKTTAFPAALALASSWNTDLARDYARAVGEECRAGGIGILLGPGLNLYRNSQCGRNFEYFGEDPYLTACLAEGYVLGVTSTGVMATLKHFVANNTDWRRRTSNSVVDERTLQELYMPAFQAGIEAGAMAVMTAYNLLNGEYCGQSREVISDLLRGSLGFAGLVMTDWDSVLDARKILTSGQDLEMPLGACLRRDGERLIETGEVAEEHLDRMVRSILQSLIAAGLFDRSMTDEALVEAISSHQDVALETARQGVVLLKNTDAVLPLKVDGPGVILLTGTFAEAEAKGGGSSEVEGFGFVSMRSALEEVFGDRLVYRRFPSEEELRVADFVIQSIGRIDSEGWDQPFDLPAAEEAKVQRAVNFNPKTIVAVNAGGGVNMSAWHERAAAILYAWYPGQVGNRALAEIIAGTVNPSGKLPCTIERRFEDSPAYGYMPETGEFYRDWFVDGDFSLPHNDVRYAEGVLMGYRWYDAKGFTPLYAFGHGLSYTTFAYDDLRIEVREGEREPLVDVGFTVRNTTWVAGAEVTQLYVGDERASVLRPIRELKRFRKVYLEPYAEERVEFTLRPRDLAFWDPRSRSWRWEPGFFTISVGGSSDRLPLQARFELCS